MHKVISAEQLAANRRNARLSTGDRTPAGKDRPARNNTRHGLHSHSLFLTPGPEDHAEFEALRASLHGDLTHTAASPLDKGRQTRVGLDFTVRAALIDRLARLIWLSRRSIRFEANAGTETDFFQNSAFNAYIRFENRINRLLHHTLACLKDLNELPDSLGAFRTGQCPDRGKPDLADHSAPAAARSET